MFGLEYLTAMVKVLFQIAFSIVSAIPFYFAWNCVAPVYFVSMIPQVFLNLPYWHIVGLFLACTYIGEQIKKIVPTLVSVSQNNTNGNN